MLFDIDIDTDTEIIDLADNEEMSADKPVDWIPVTPLEEAYVWKKALKFQIVGKLSPAMRSGEGSRAPVKFDFILPDATAVEYLNGFRGSLGLKPRTKKQWQKWINFWSFSPLSDGPLDIITKLPKTPRF